MPTNLKPVDAIIHNLACVSLSDITSPNSTSSETIVTIDHMLTMFYLQKQICISTHLDLIMFVILENLPSYVKDMYHLFLTFMNQINQL